MQSDGVLMRYAVVENETGNAIPDSDTGENFTGKVLNVIEADEDFAAPEGASLIASEEASEGDTYEVRKKTLFKVGGQGFVKAEVTAKVSPQTEYAAASTNTKKLAVLAKYAGLVIEKEVIEEE